MMAVDVQSSLAAEWQQPHDDQRYLSVPASYLYDKIDANRGFQSSDSLYNYPPPTPLITLSIGCLLSLVGFLLWIHRVLLIRAELREILMAKADADQSKKSLKSLCGWWTLSLRMRCWLTAYMENDSALFTCIRMAGQSLILLAGLQWNYRLAFLIGLVVLGLLQGSADTFRIFLALRESANGNDLVVTSKFLRADLRKHPLTTTLVPTNVYEDFTRDFFVVGMIFVTQILLIGFVVADVLGAETHYCLDGTPDCPVVGTLGSWSFYLVGIFMACVFHLGPKTNFGQKSEQNPAYWLKLFLSVQRQQKSNNKGGRKGYKESLLPSSSSQRQPSSSGEGSSYSWYDPVEDLRKTITIGGDGPCMGMHWVRYWMSFLINGVGFHVLVHTLPIQVAAQSTLTGVVFRAVGMIYLVNLDDSSGNKLTMINNPEDDSDGDDTDDATDVGSLASMYSYFGGEEEEDEVDIVRAAEKIIVMAQSKLEGLRFKKKRNKKATGTNNPNNKTKTKRTKRDPLEGGRSTKKMTSTATIDSLAEF